MWGKELSERPALVFFLSLILGLSVALGWWMLLLGVFLIWLADWQKVGLIVAAGMALGYFLHPEEKPRPPLINPQPVELVGYATQIPRERVDVLSMVVEAQGQRIQLTAKAGVTPDVGDLIQVKGILASADEIQIKRGLDAVVRSEEPVSILRKGQPFWALTSGVRDSFRDFLSSALQPRTAGLLLALCFGVTTDISPEDMRSITASGAAHVIAASGLNVLIVAGGFLGSLSLIPLPRWMKLVLLGLVLILYGGAAGFGTPIVRALLMTAIFLSAELFRREPEPLSSVSLAGIISLAFDPSDVFSIGFWLSYSAVFALILFGGSSSVAGGFVLREFRSIFRTSGVATLATGPIIALAFGQAPLLGLVTNLAVVPLCSILVLAPLTLWLASGLAPDLTRSLLSSLIEPLLGWMLLVFENIAGQSWSLLSVPSFSIIWIFACGIMTLLLWKPQRREA